MADAELYGLACYLCGQPIDYQLTRELPQHPMAGTVHHIIGLAQGGDPLDPANLAPAHRGCNSREGNRMRREIKKAPGMISSRRW